MPSPFEMLEAAKRKQAGKGKDARGEYTDAYLAAHPRSHEFFGGGAGPGWNQNEFRRQYLGDMAEEDAMATEAEGSAYKRASEWDPSAAFKDWTAGATGDANNALGLQLEKLAGQSVGAGRLDTGFFDQDQGEVVRDVWGDLNRNIQSKAMDLTGMQQSNNQFMLGYGERKRNNYLDLLAGGMDRRDMELAREQDQKNEDGKGSFWDVAAGVVTGAAKGALTGNPYAAVAGGAAGGYNAYRRGR